MTCFTVRVYGRPMPEGSKTAFLVKRPSGKIGAAVTEADQSKTKAVWRADVVAAARRELDAGAQPFAQYVPLAVTVEFLLPRPTSEPKRRRTWPSKQVADLDKLVRAMCDAFTVAGVWHDDSQVVEIHASKDFVSVEHPEPGAAIVVEPIPAYVDQLALVGVQ